MKLGIIGGYKIAFTEATFAITRIRSVPMKI